MHRHLCIAFLPCLVACGGDTSGDDSSGVGGATAGSSTSSTSSSVAASTASASATNASSSTGSEDPVPCVLAEAEDRTGSATLTIVAAGVNYSPRCVRVAAGTAVTFAIDFVTHPLFGGAVVDGVGTPDPASPIPTTTSGSTVTVTLDDAGEVPFFCDRHASIGMFGTIWVE